MRIKTFATVTFAAKLVSGATHLITVGGDTLTFTPSYVSAAAGDVVRFELYVQPLPSPVLPSNLYHSHVKNHTATQSSFSTPCSPLAGGFDSGL